MTAELRCTFSGFNPATNKLTITDQTPTTGLLFRVDNTAPRIIDQYYDSYVVSSVVVKSAQVPVGMTVTVGTDKKVAFDLTPAKKLGGVDYPEILEIFYYEVSDPGNILGSFLVNVHVQSLIRKIYYYDNNLGGKLVKYWLAPEYVSFKNAWVSGTSYNADDTVTYGGFEWFALQGMYTAPQITTPPSEGAYWTSFPYDKTNFHVKAACLDSPNNTTKFSSIWGKVFFSTDITGKFVNPVFYENGSKPDSASHTGILKLLAGTTTVFETKNLQGGAYEASVSDTSIGSSFYLSFSYSSPTGVSPTVRPSMPPLTIVRDLTSTFTSNGSPVSSPVTVRAGQNEPAYKLEVNVTGHIANLPVGTNYANLVYRAGADFGTNGFADFVPITTDTTKDIYIVPSSTANTFADPVGKTSYQLKFNTANSYYVIGRPVGDANQTSSTLAGTTNALRLIVEPAISTAFTLGPFTAPQTGTFDIPVNMTNVTKSGSLQWTLKGFVGITPVVSFYSKNNTTLAETLLGTTVGADVVVPSFTYNSNISYLLRITANTPTSGTYANILTLTNLTYATSTPTSATLTFNRPGASFIINPTSYTVLVGGPYDTIVGSYAGLPETVDAIVPTGSPTLTFGPAQFTSGLVTGSFIIPITGATTENPSGYAITIKPKHLGSDILVGGTAASAVATVVVNTSAGKPSISLYNTGSEYPILCQTQITDTDTKVCGGWHNSVKRTDPVSGTPATLINKAYFTLKNSAGAYTKAGLYDIWASFDNSNWTKVLAATGSVDDTSSADFNYVTITRHANDTYPFSVTIRDGFAVTKPFIYIKASLLTNESLSFKITTLPNIQVLTGTQTPNLTSHITRIQDNAAALFLVNTAFDGWTQESVTRYESSTSLFVAFPSVDPFIKDENWVVQRKDTKVGGLAKYRLFFETNDYNNISPTSNYFFISFKDSDGSVINVYKVLLTIDRINSSASANLRTNAGTITALTFTGQVVTFIAGVVDAQRLYTYSQSASSPTTWVEAIPSSQVRTYTVTSTDGTIYIVASSGDLLNAIKYAVVGQTCTLVPTSTFLNSFILPTASTNYYYPAGATPSTPGGVKLPSKVQVVTSSGGTPQDKTVNSGGIGWQFLSATYEGVSLQINPSFQSMYLSDTFPSAFKFEIIQNGGVGTDYRLKLPAVLNVGGLPVTEASSLTIIFRATFSDGTCAVVSGSVPIRQYTYTTDSAVIAEACNYFPPFFGGSQQHELTPGYSSLEEVIVNNIPLSILDFNNKYGLDVLNNQITTPSLTTPLEAATLSDAYFGFSDLSYTIYTIISNGSTTKKIVPLSYTKQYTSPNYLPYPQKIGLISPPTLTSLTCYNGDKVYISLLSTISPAFSFVNYEFVFINGTTIIPQAIGNYDSVNKVLSFDVTPGIFVTGTLYTLGIRHKTTDCVYFGTSAITFTCGGPRPSGPMEITQPAEQEPCTPSITINAKSSTGTDISSITRVQVYKTNAGTILNNFVGDVSVWDNVTPSIGSTKKDLSFFLNNSTKEFASLITSKKQQDYFVSFYTGSAAGGYVPFAQGVPLALVLKNPVLIGAETNSNRQPALTSPVPTLYENTLSITCSSCKDGACATANLASLSTIQWTDSLSAPLPDWLTLTPDLVNFNKALLSGSPDTATPASFTIIATVPYYVDGNDAPYTHTHEFPITLEPTSVFSIGGDIDFPNATHYQDTYTQTFTVTNQPAVDCAALTWSITDRELAGADKALPPSTLASPITLSNGVFTWLDVDDPDAAYPVKYVFAVQAVCTGGSLATGVVTLTVDPRNPVVSGLVPVYGYFDIPNDTVTITGLDFYPGTVRFGNEEATNILVNVTNDALTCTPPTRADIGGADLPVDVIIYNSDGGFSQSGIKYTYQRKKSPIITDIIPSGGTFRGGTKVAIIGANFEPTSTVIIDDVLQPILSVTPTAIIFVTMPHSVGQSVIQVTNSVPPVSDVTYTFAAEPRVSDVQPYNLPADGGIDVYIIGTDFQQGVRIFLDDYEIPADRITVL